MAFLEFKTEPFIQTKVVEYSHSTVNINTVRSILPFVLLGHFLHWTRVYFFSTLPNQKFEVIIDMEPDVFNQ